MKTKLLLLGALLPVLVPLHSQATPDPYALLKDLWRLLKSSILGREGIRFSINTGLAGAYVVLVKDNPDLVCSWENTQAIHLFVRGPEPTDHTLVKLHGCR